MRVHGYTVHPRYLKRIAIEFLFLQLHRCLLLSFFITCLLLSYSFGNNGPYILYRKSRVIYFQTKIIRLLGIFIVSLISESNIIDTILNYIHQTKHDHQI
jgi:hypothetical protein